jgi:arylsulfatase A-like enzyme
MYVSFLCLCLALLLSVELSNDRRILPSDSSLFFSCLQSPYLFCPTFTRPQYWNQTWAGRLKDAGYYVGHVGKWQYHNNNFFFKNAFDFNNLHEGKHFYGGIPAADYSRDKAIEFLKQRPQNTPFAMTVAFYPPKPVGDSNEPGGQWSPTEEYYNLYRNHTFVRPYNITEAYEKVLPIFGMARWRFTRRWETDEQYQEGLKRYFALISHVDRASQQIVEELKEQGVYNNTMIIFTTDKYVFKEK